MKNKVSAFAVFILILIVLGNGYKTVSTRDSNKPAVLAWDIFGYYLYLPATFIYNDIGLENHEWIDSIQKNYTPSPVLYQLGNGVDNKRAIIYHMGLSIVYAPAFFLAHAYAKLTEYPADGFSAPYQWAIILLGFTYAALGLLLFRKILLYFFSDRLAAILLALTVLGTNYLVQVSQGSEMPHNFLFTLNCCIVLLTIKWHKQPALKYAIGLSLLLATVIVCRPTEIVMVLIPLLWNVKDKVSFKNKLLLLKTYLWHMVIIAGGIGLLLLLQLSYWKYTTGSISTMNFHAETLTIWRPFTIKFLFSYKKGWLLYTPLMVFAIIGFIRLYRNNRSVFYALFLFFIGNLWLISSWECWWYATSFSQRPMVESYMIMAVPLGYLIKELSTANKIVKGLIAACLIFCTVLNLFQSWQFNSYILDNERMTKKYYWKIFGKTHIDPRYKELLEIDRNFPPDGKEILRPEKEFNYNQKEVYFNNYESETGNEIVSNVFHSGSKSMKMDSIIKYSAAIKKEYRSVTKKDHFWLRASFYVYPTAPVTESPFTIVFEYKSNGRGIKWAGAKTDTLTLIPNKWNFISVDNLTPIVLQRDDEFHVYAWNIGNKTVYIDDFKLEAFVPKN